MIDNQAKRQPRLTATGKAQGAGLPKSFRDNISAPCVIDAVCGFMEPVCLSGVQSCLGPILSLHTLVPPIWNGSINCLLLYIGYI